MKFCQKLRELRREYNYSQELLAEMCRVSRQAVSKWEADTARPNIDTYLRLSEIFNVPVDILVKDELAINNIKKNDTCHANVLTDQKTGLFEGILIKESLSDDSVLDYLNINKIEIWKTDDWPKYWTALYFTSSKSDLPDIFSKVITNEADRGGNWYVDFRNAETQYVVFKGKILKYNLNSESEKAEVLNECRLLGIEYGGN